MTVYTGKQDEEFFAQRALDAVLAGFNTKVTAINSEKGDSVSMKTVDATAVYMIDPGTPPNADPFIVLGVDWTSEGTTTAGRDVAERMTVSLEVGFTVLNLQAQTVFWRLMMRYRRTAKEVLKETFGKFPAAQVTAVDNIRIERNDRILYITGAEITFSVVY